MLQLALTVRIVGQVLPLILVIDDADEEGSEMLTELGQHLIEGHAHKLDEPNLHTGQLILLPPIHHCLHKTIRVQGHCLVCQWWWLVLTTSKQKLYRLCVRLRIENSRHHFVQVLSECNIPYTRYVVHTQGQHSY